VAIKLISFAIKIFYKIATLNDIKIPKYGQFPAIWTSGKSRVEKPLEK
jgi:hypothetical protein